MNNGLIHISGCDLTTKSTICEKLGELTGYKIRHFDKVNSLEEGKKQYLDFLTYENEGIQILDRFHDGEWIYAPLYRGYTANYLDKIEEKLSERPYLFVNTYSSLETIIKRKQERGEDFVKEDDFSKVLDGFYEFTMKQNMPFARINTDNPDSEKNAKDIIKYFEIVQEIFNSNTKKDKYCGNLLAKNLIVIDDKVFFDEIKNELIEKNVYDNCWLTTNKSKRFVKKLNELLPNIVNIKTLIV